MEKISYVCGVTVQGVTINVGVVEISPQGFMLASSAQALHPQPEEITCDMVAVSFVLDKLKKEYMNEICVTDSFVFDDLTRTRMRRGAGTYVQQVRNHIKLLQKQGYAISVKNVSSDTGYAPYLKMATESSKKMCESSHPLFSKYINLLQEDPKSETNKDKINNVVSIGQPTVTKELNATGACSIHLSKSGNKWMARINDEDDIYAEGSRVFRVYNKVLRYVSEELATSFVTVYFEETTKTDKELFSQWLANQLVNEKASNRDFAKKVDMRLKSGKLHHIYM